MVNELLDETRRVERQKLVNGAGRQTLAKEARGTQVPLVTRTSTPLG